MSNRKSSTLLFKVFVECRIGYGHFTCFVIIFPKRTFSRIPVWLRSSYLFWHHTLHTWQLADNKDVRWRHAPYYCFRLGEHRHHLNDRQYYCKYKQIKIEFHWWFNQQSVLNILVWSVIWQCVCKCMEDTRLIHSPIVRTPILTSDVYHLVRYICFPLSYLCHCLNFIAFRHCVQVLEHLPL